jgi:hypothetical protein
MSERRLLRIIDSARCVGLRAEELLVALAALALGHGDRGAVSLQLERLAKSAESLLRKINRARESGS